MNWQKFAAERRSSVFSGIAALIIIGVGFLAFNGLSQNDNKKETKKETKQIEQKKEETKTTTKETEKKTTIKTHVVVSGESLSKIAKSYYNDGNKWTVIAAANKIANPNLIYRGVVLTIPDITSQTASAVTSTKTAISSDTTVNQPKTYTVVKGDSLWTISQNFYNGNGYHWVIIRDANPRKVGLLPNGRPLITPGTVLTIPATPSG